MTVPLVTLRKMVRDRLGVPAHDSFFTDPVVTTNVNLAIMSVESEYRWPWAERYVTFQSDATGQFSTPANWRATRAVWVDRQQLEEMAPYMLLERYSSDPVGVPRHFSIINSIVYLRPIPSTDITISHLYFERATLLANDNDEPLIPTEHIGTVIAKAAQLTSIREDDRPSADSHLAEYLTGIERMRKQIPRNRCGARVSPLRPDPTGRSLQ